MARPVGELKLVVRDDDLLERGRIDERGFLVPTHLGPRPNNAAGIFPLNPLPVTSSCRYPSRSHNKPAAGALAVGDLQQIDMLVAAVGVVVAQLVATVGAEGKEVSRLVGPSTEQPSKMDRPGRALDERPLFHARAALFERDSLGRLEDQALGFRLDLAVQKVDLDLGGRPVVSRSADGAERAVIEGQFHARNVETAQMGRFGGDKRSRLEG